MTSGETAYLIMVIVAFGLFGLALAWTLWRAGRK